MEKSKTEKLDLLEKKIDDFHKNIKNNRFIISNELQIGRFFDKLDDFIFRHYSSIKYKPTPHETVELDYKENRVKIDKKIAPLIQEMWKHQINTIM